MLRRWLAGALLTLLAALALMTLAYQRPAPLRLAIGDETSDKGVVHNFYADERREDGFRFRWTRGDSSIALPAWGPGPYRLTVEMAAPLNPDPTVTVLVNDMVVGQRRLTGDFQPYTFDVPDALAPTGDLTITFRSPTFSPPRDRRTLGVVLHAVTLEPLTARPLPPPIGAVSTGTLLALLAYATLGAAGWGWRTAAGGAVGLTGALAILLASQRLLIVPVLAELPWIAALALGVTALLRIGWVVASRLLLAASGGDRTATPAASEVSSAVLARPDAGDQPLAGSGVDRRDHLCSGDGECPPDIPPPSRDSGRGPGGWLSRQTGRWRFGRRSSLAGDSAGAAPPLLLTIVAAALLVRLATTLHPQMDIIDLGFHVNRFTDVENGNLFLRVRSAEWGGRETTYSPAAYLAMMPLSWLVDDKHRMIRIFTALLETSRLLLVFALARWVAGNRAGLLAATLFVSLPLSVLVFSWGITSNLFGEWWATALLVALALGWRRLTQPAVAALAVVVATLALLAHPGVLLLTGAALTLLILGLALEAVASGQWSVVSGVGKHSFTLASSQRERGRERHPLSRGEGWGEGEPSSARSLMALVGVVVLAVALAFGLFYRVDAAMMLEQGTSTIAQRLGGAPAASDQPRRWRVSGSVDDKSLGMGARYVTDWREVPLAGLIGYVREAWAYYWGWPLLAAVAGWWLIGDSARGRRLRRLALAWAGAAALFALAGLLINLYVRYMLFLLPVVCVLAGVALDRLAGRGRWGAALVALLLAAALLGGLWFWHQRLVYFFH